MSSKESYEKVKDTFQTLTKVDGSFSVHGMWKVKQKTFPKNPKKTTSGRLVSNHEELKSLYLETFRNRLRHRKMKHDFLEIQNLKETLCFKRLQLVRLENVHKWTTIEIDRALSSLKNNKSRDPHNLNKLDF